MGYVAAFVKDKLFDSPWAAASSVHAWLWIQMDAAKILLEVHSPAIICQLLEAQVPVALCYIFPPREQLADCRSLRLLEVHSFLHYRLERNCAHACRPKLKWWQFWKITIIHLFVITRMFVNLILSEGMFKYSDYSFQPWLKHEQFSSF